MVKIGADRDGENAYTNYYFAVYYNDAAGRNLVRYPANNITMIRTFSSWDVQLDGRFTNVSIRPRSEFNIPYEADEQYSTPVNAFVFAESFGLRRFLRRSFPRFIEAASRSRNFWASSNKFFVRSSPTTR